MATRSPSPSDSTLTMALPLAWRPPSGISWTLSQCTLPLLVKKSRKEWVEATNRSSTMSSSLVSIPVTPLPPRRWLRYASMWVRLM